MKHYHTISGLRGGYLPNQNNLSTTLKAAVADARWQIEQYRESGEKVRGGVIRNANQLQSIGGNCRAYWIARESQSLPGTFWDYIEVSGPCRDDCEESYD